MGKISLFVLRTGHRSTERIAREAPRQTFLDSVEVLMETLHSLLPKMWGDQEDLPFLLEDLARFGITTKEALAALIGKHYNTLLCEQKELLELIGQATAGFMPCCNNLNYSQAGMVRMALYHEFGHAWCRYANSLPVNRAGSGGK